MTATLKDLAPKHVLVKVPAKINLSLKVAPLGKDGFHQLATVFHAVSIYDEVTVTMVKPGQEEISVGGDQKYKNYKHLWQEEKEQTNRLVSALQLVRQSVKNH